MHHRQEARYNPIGSHLSDHPLYQPSSYNSKKVGLFVVSQHLV
jgi:hypothetical protein